MIRIVPLKFQNAGRQYDFNALSIELKAGDKIIVETDRGRAMAIAVTAPREIEDNKAPEGLKPILRIATEEDLALADTNAAREKDAHRFCVQKIQSRQLEMKLVRAEYAFDGSKIIFFFTADGRIDFRELVKDLAHHFHTRIEMRQIGVRDEAKLVGGLGICGRELCCCSFLTQFTPVSVKMAKEQGLALNPSKISGQCGRLLCCLSYEFETYSALRKGMPKTGKKIIWQEREHEVINQDILRQQITLRDREGTTCSITLEEFRTGQAKQPQEEEKPAGESHTSRLQKSRPKGQQQKKQSGKGQQPRRPQGKQQSKQGDQEQNKKQQAPGEQKHPDGSHKKKQDQNKPNEGQSKRRRRGRRKPRSARKPDPSKQGE